MKTIKQVLCPERVRTVPQQFSWVDQALVQHHLIDRCDSRSATLYLFLITVADHQGLSSEILIRSESTWHYSEKIFYYSPVKECEFCEKKVPPQF